MTSYNNHGREKIPKNRKTEPTFQIATPTTAANTMPMTKTTTLPAATTKTAMRTISQ